MSGCPNGTVPTETYTVVVRIPKPLTTRIAETWTECRHYCGSCVFYTILLVILVNIFYLIWLVVIDCQQGPGMTLEDLRVSDITVHQNTTTGAPAPEWQVDSALNVTLSTWNRNRVAGCFTTYRRVVVRVEYRGQTILQQEVPLGFSLRPRRSRPVAMQLQGRHFQLQNPDLGVAMEAELRNGTVNVQVFFDTRYLRNDRKAEWMHFGCAVVAATPSQSVPGSLLRKQCYPT